MRASRGVRGTPGGTSPQMLTSPSRRGAGRPHGTDGARAPSESPTPRRPSAARATSSTKRAQGRGPAWRERTRGARAAPENCAMLRPGNGFGWRDAGRSLAPVRGDRAGISGLSGISGPSGWLRVERAHAVIGRRGLAPRHRDPSPRLRHPRRRLRLQPGRRGRRGRRREPDRLRREHVRQGPLLRRPRFPLRRRLHLLGPRLRRWGRGRPVVLRPAGGHPGGRVRPGRMQRVVVRRRVLLHELVPGRSLRLDLRHVRKAAQAASDRTPSRLLASPSPACSPACRRHPTQMTLW